MAELSWADHRHLAIVEDEQHQAGGNADAQSLQQADEGNDGEHQHCHRVLRPGTAQVDVEQRRHQHVEADVEQQAADQQLRQQGDGIATEAKDQEDNGGDDHTGCPGRLPMRIDSKEVLSEW